MNYIWEPIQLQSLITIVTEIGARFLGKKKKKKKKEGKKKQLFLGRKWMENKNFRTPWEFVKRRKITRWYYKPVTDEPVERTCLLRDDSFKRASRYISAMTPFTHIHFFPRFTRRVVKRFVKKSFDIFFFQFDLKDLLKKKKKRTSVCI